MQQRIGIGYDIHKFVKGRKLFLGGVEIPYEQGLEGHSDADVVLHAICDGLLGALGQGDIGEHFPNTDPQYKDVSSGILLSRVYEIVQKEKFSVGNIDVVILAEAPNLKSFKPQMQTAIAQILKMDESLINIKATTHEGLGAIGRKEGIAAYAGVFLVKR